MEDDLDDLYGDTSTVTKPASPNMSSTIDSDSALQTRDTSTTAQLLGITDQIHSNPAVEKKEAGQPDAEVNANTTSANVHESDPTEPKEAPQQDKLVPTRPEPSSEEHQTESVISSDIPIVSSAAPSNEAVHEPSTGGQAEWEVDSSPYESSSDDSSDTSSSDSEEDYEMLEVAEQARRLMENDANSEDEGGSREAKGATIKSHNEQTEEPIVKPDIPVTEDMPIEILGTVETLVDHIALIKAKISGEFQVLEAGSLLCLSSRTVIGVVSETLGRVQQPLYCVRFESSSAITEAGIAVGTVIYYVPQHSTFVFTKALQAVKGSDASNIHDEEAAGDEIEFSDDEAEAAYKRNLKAEKREKRINKPDQRANGYSQSRDGESANAPVHINYDDEPQDDLYTPLTRPSNLHEMMNTGAGRGRDSSRGQRGDGGRGNRRGARNHRGRGDRGRGYSEQHTHRAAPPSHHFPQSPGPASPTSPWGQNPLAYGIPPRSHSNNMNSHFNGPIPYGFNQPPVAGAPPQQVYQQAHPSGQYPFAPPPMPPHYPGQQHFGQQPQYYPPHPPAPPPPHYPYRQAGQPNPQFPNGAAINPRFFNPPYNQNHGS